jgi:SHS2 domain-containing protein
MAYETFEHTADLGLRVCSDSRRELFEDAARGLFSMLLVNPEDVRPLLEKKYAIAGDELDYLLFDWLAELLYTFETENLLFCRFDVEIGEQGLRATCWGEPVDISRHKMDHEVKAITYHGLRVQEQDDGNWLAEVIVDI